MKKKLILISAPPACGKNYVSERICSSLKHVAYVDKDDLADLVRKPFALCEERLDMDGAFYLNNLRDVEYATMLKIAFSALQFEDLVLVNAPFLKEVRDIEYMKGVKERAKTLGAELVVVWVIAPLDVCYERMKQRNSDRDELKLANWQAYVEKTNYAPPVSLREQNAVDTLFVFDNANGQTAEKSLQEILKILGE